MSGELLHFEVLGADHELRQRLYAEAFGWSLHPTGPGYAIAHPGGSSGTNGGIGVAPDGAKGHVTFYAEVDDVAHTLARIKALGGPQPPLYMA